MKTETTLNASEHSRIFAETVRLTEAFVAGNPDPDRAQYFMKATYQTLEGLFKNRAWREPRSGSPRTSDHFNPGVSGPTGT